MCEGCPAEVLALAERVAAYMTAHGWAIAGGLHIVLQDENVADDHITWCQQNADLDEPSAAFARELLAMPVPHRHMVIQLAADNLLPDILEDARRG